MNQQGDPLPSGHSRAQRRPLVKPRPIRLEDCPAGSRHDLQVPLYQDALGAPLQVPFIVLRGRHPGPVVGISAAVHGNELNGIKIIHGLVARLDPSEMHGSLLCAPVVNVPAYQAGQRRFPDGVDLNHAFPGRAEGKPSEQYARAFLVTFLGGCDYLIDIHTASEGRLNSMYVRADLHSQEAREMALLMNPQIVLHGRSGDGTLRNAARLRGIPAITVEAGNPSVFQGKMVLEAELGVLNILSALGVIRRRSWQPIERTPVICRASRWLRTTTGGLLETRFGLCDRVARRQLLAEVRDALGYVLEEYHAPADGIVIGMSASPVAVPGTRYCHLGTVGEPALQRGESLEPARRSLLSDFDQLEPEARERGPA